MRYVFSILIALIMLSLTGGISLADGITIWGSAEQEIDSQAAVTGRIGYKVGNIEPFVGSKWYPRDEYPQCLTLGGVMYGPDLADPNSSVPAIPEVLLFYLSDEAVITPYAGIQASWGFVDDDAGFYGGIMGILIKDKPDTPLSVTVEVEWNDNTGKLANITDGAKVGIGLRYEF